ncbi:hypothetical protein NIES4072_68320 [Nostoc commune NIES-4072]|uniref:Uncharacterized protein n=1 Tax=Nostoc commune NIES-4072 TaxID=2005467 RepID=A0A2R5FWM8_NOSCO|nr:hypothetical protein NIES4072_68320 [Nostoc commune NIES-4072]
MKLRKFSTAKKNSSHTQLIPRKRNSLSEVIVFGVAVVSKIGGYKRTLLIPYSSLPYFNQIPYRSGILPASDTFSSLSETHSRSRGNALSVAMPQALRHVFSTRRTRVRRTPPIHGRYA